MIQKDQQGLEFPANAAQYFKMGVELVWRAFVFGSVHTMVKRGFRGSDIVIRTPIIDKDLSH